jgi:hypothetical protein
MSGMGHLRDEYGIVGVAAGIILAIGFAIALWPITLLALAWGLAETFWGPKVEPDPAEAETRAMPAAHRPFDRAEYVESAERERREREQERTARLVADARLWPGERAA